MLSLIPTILFAIQSIFLYFERDILDIDNTSFVIIGTIISFNLLIIFLTYFLKKGSNSSNYFSKVNEKLSNKKNSIVIFLIYLFLFFIQVFIRGNIPALTGFLSKSVVIYNTWPISPFSGFMTILFLLILGERISAWTQLKNSSQNNETNNVILFLMVFISLLMLRRDLLGLLVFCYCINMFILIKKLFNEIIIRKK